MQKECVKNRRATLTYLMQMAEEMQKMAHIADMPSMELLFDMVKEEALHCIRESDAEEISAAGATDEPKQAELEAQFEETAEDGGIIIDRRPKKALSENAATDIAKMKMQQYQAYSISFRKSRNHAPLMTNNVSRKLQLQKPEIQA